MKVRELVEMLEEYDDDAEVLAVHQPSWPLRERVAGVWQADQDLEPGDDADSDFGDLPPDPAVYVVLGGHPSEGSPYGSADAFRAVDAW